MNLVLINSPNAVTAGSVGRFGIPVIYGDVFACASLLCPVGLWILPLLFLVFRMPLPEMTGSQALAAMAVSVLLAGIGVFLKSQLSKLAPPIAVLMFFFVIYANGV